MSFQRQMLCALLTAALVVSSAASASIGSDLQSFFGDMNYSNVTGPGVYEGQSAGYYTGGSVYARTPVREYNLLNVTLPRFRAGCGGIDLFSGGFSFINADQFVEMLKNVGQNAKGLAFMLALQVVSPQISEKVGELMDYAQKFNNSSINSCEQATNILGGAMELFGAQEQSCTLQRAQKLGEDYATARQNCRVNPNDTGAGATEEPPIFTDGNLAWKAMMPIDFYRSDLDIAEIAMNLTGTVIIENDRSSPNPEPRIIRIPSMLLSSNGSDASNPVLTMLLRGGAAKIYTCEDKTIDVSACVKVSATPAEISLAESDALVKKVRDLLDSLVIKIAQDDTGPTDEELGLIRSTSLPVYKYLTVTTALFRTEADGNARIFAEFIAKDLLYVYLLDLLKKVEDGASRLADGAAREDIRKFIQDIRDARRAIQGAKTELPEQLDTFMLMTQRSRSYEEILVQRMNPQILQSALFGQRQ